MGMDSLLGFYLPIKYQTPVRRTYCPKCGSQSNLEDTPRGLHCKYCHWHESGGQYPKYLPRVPDNPSP
jgi:ribosomal protein L37AE/L43A